jgi:hypothetical protein
MRQRGTQLPDRYGIDSASIHRAHGPLGTRWQGARMHRAYPTCSERAGAFPMASRFDARIDQGINQLADPSRVLVTFVAFYIRRGAWRAFPMRTQNPLRANACRRSHSKARQCIKTICRPRAVYERSRADDAVLVRHHVKNARRMRSRKDSEARERDPRGGGFHFDGPR